MKKIYLAVVLCIVALGFTIAIYFKPSITTGSVLIDEPVLCLTSHDNEFIPERSLDKCCKLISASSACNEVEGRLELSYEYEGELGAYSPDYICSEGSLKIYYKKEIKALC